MKKTTLKILSLLGAIFCTLFSLCSNTSIIVRADDENIVDYKETKILDDLSDVSTALYPKNPLGEPQIIRFQEYCYSEKGFYEMHYGLFVYIYNPTEEPLRTDRNFNKLNMATEYNDKGEPTEYSNVRLTYCSNVSNRIYKFYVADPLPLLNMAKAYMKEHGKRRYDIAGMQLAPVDGEIKDTQAHESMKTYGYTYYFTGYAETCDINNPSAESTLKCTMQPLETVKLEIQQTNYRTGDYQNFICDELNTVYFSVDDYYFEEYGNLQKIKAEWYEYKTKPIFVTSDSDANEALKPYIGKDIGESTDELDWSVVWEEYYYVTTLSYYLYNKAYNKSELGWSLGATYEYGEDCVFLPRLDWFFYKAGATNAKSYSVSKEEVAEYALNYSKENPGDKLVGAFGEYSASLFESSIDADRLALVQEHNKNATNGYVCQEIDAGDTGNLTVQKDQGFWDKLWNGVQYEQKGYDPIIVLDDLDKLSNMSAESFAQEYLVKAEEAASILDYCKTEIKNGGKVVLFRFAVTDYYTSTARFECTSNVGISDTDGYVAQETVFLNFDIISLTFRGAEGADVVIPCVADPIDIINGVDAPPDLNTEEDKWAWLVKLLTYALILIVVIVVILNLFPELGKIAISGCAKALTGVGVWIRNTGQAFKTIFIGNDKNGNGKKGGKK